MEYRMELHGQAIGLDQLRQAITGGDASALVDLDPKGGALLVATCLAEDELVALIGEAGFPAAAGQLVRAASVCCGGCGG
jgi:hypothetical protein